MTRGQLQHPLNWILILVAGAFFLILFLALTRSIISSEEGISEARTINTLNTIIANSRANIDTQTTVEFTELEVTCIQGATIIAAGNQERSFRQALFSPPIIEGETIIWSEEFKIVSPITTLTHLFPKETVYVLTESVDEDLAKKLAPLEPRRVTDLSTITTNNHVVVISKESLEGLRVDGDAPVGIQYDADTLTFYTYNNGFVHAGNEPTNNQFLLAGIAAGTPERYACGQSIVDEHVRFLAVLNKERITNIPASQPACIQAYNRARAAFDALHTNGLSVLDAQERELRLASQTLSRQGCPNI